MESVARSTAQSAIRHRGFWLVAGSVATLLVGSVDVRAQDAPADDIVNDPSAIVVTAQRRSELSRDVPITVTTLNETKLRDANVTSLMDLPRLAPGVRFDQQGAYTQPVIRGIGTTIGLTAAGNSVGIYVDGFYLPNSLAVDFPFLNVENVQVLKGPQGTLFGRNTTAGAILIKTAEPSTETKAVAEAAYERFNTGKLQGYFTTGLTDRIAVSLEGGYSSSDGFLKNVYDGSLATGGGFAPGARRKNPGAYEKWMARAAIKAELSDSASIILRYEHLDNRDPGGVAGGTWVGQIDGQAYPFSAGDTLPGTKFGLRRGEVANNARTDFRMKSDTLQLTGRFDLGFADLTSYSQYREETVQQFLDSDYSSATILALNLPEDNRVISQELLLTSKPGGRLQYTAGAFFYEGKVDLGVNLSTDNVNFTPFLGNGGTIRTYAAFFDATYEVVDNLFITGGLRYSHDQVDDPYFQTTPGVPDAFTVRQDYNDDRLSPRVVLRYKPSPESSIYASYTKGSKSAVQDTTGSSQLGGNTFYDGYYLRPEEIDAYEIGFKYADDRVSAELAGFYYDYKNLQNSYYLQGTAIYSNAAKSRIRGIDGSIAFKVTPEFEISAAATYLDAKYKDYKVAGYFVPIIAPDADGDGIPDFAGFDTSTLFDASGLQVQRAPKFSATVSARYTTELAGGRLALSTNLYHSSKVFFDAAHQFPQKAYDILAARVQWTDPSDHYTIAVYGDNLTDAKYLTQGLPSTSSVATVWGRPASYGVSIRFKM